MSLGPEGWPRSCGDPSWAWYSIPTPIVSDAPPYRHRWWSSRPLWSCLEQSSGYCWSCLYTQCRTGLCRAPHHLWSFTSHEKVGMKWHTYVLMHTTYWFQHPSTQRTRSSACGDYHGNENVPPESLSGFLRMWTASNRSSDWIVRCSSSTVTSFLYFAFRVAFGHLPSKCNPVILPPCHMAHILCTVSYHCWLQGSVYIRLQVRSPRHYKRTITHCVYRRILSLVKNVLLSVNVCQ